MTQEHYYVQSVNLKGQAAILWLGFREQAEELMAFQGSIEERKKYGTI